MKKLTVTVLIGIFSVVILQTSGCKTTQCKTEPQINQPGEWNYIPWWAK